MLTFQYDDFRQSYIMCIHNTGSRVKHKLRLHNFKEYRPFPKSFILYRISFTISFYSNCISRRVVARVSGHQLSKTVDTAYVRLTCMLCQPLTQ